MNMEEIVSIVPNKNQLSMFEMGYYNFIHFGLNTYTGKEWGSGTVPTTKFKLKNLDTDKWVKDLIKTGSKGVIITAKHHDGFCLFPSKYTGYTIANTAYKNGKGDIVKELADSCKKYNFKLGIYLSPWDRHEPTYGTDEYNDFFCNQLTELCTNYGDIFCFWFDGACGEGKNGKIQRYDWNRYFDVIHKYQPNACITNCGEDFRWIGNEHGIARESEWSVVPKRLQCYDKVMAESQQKAGAFNMLTKIDQRDKNLGYIETLLNENDLCYWPSEMNIPITYVGWFYNPIFDILFTRSVKNLVKCYSNSVGHNATFLVNVPPDKKGNLPKKYIDRLTKMNKIINGYFSTEVKNTVYKDGDVYKVLLDRKESVSKIVIGEDIEKSQRVESYEIIINGNVVYKGTTIGYKQFCFFESCTTNQIVVKINKCRCESFIKYIKLYS